MRSNSPASRIGIRASGRRCGRANDRRHTPRVVSTFTIRRPIIEASPLLHGQIACHVGHPSLDGQAAVVSVIPRIRQRITTLLHSDERGCLGTIAPRLLQLQLLAQEYPPPLEITVMLSPAGFGSMNPYNTGKNLPPLSLKKWPSNPCIDGLSSTFNFPRSRTFSSTSSSVPSPTSPYPSSPVRPLPQG